MGIPEVVVVCEWLGTIVSLSSALAIAHKKAWGLWGFIFADLFLAVVAVDHQLWGLLALYVAYSIINVIGILKWRS